MRNAWSAARIGILVAAVAAARQPGIANGAPACPADAVTGRYRVTGALPTFRETGGNTVRLTPIARQADGKLLASDFRSRVVRYLPGGGLDLDFGRLGIVDLAPELSSVRDIVVAPDGSILVGGASHVGAPNVFTIARLLP